MLLLFLSQLVTLTSAASKAQDKPNRVAQTRARGPGRAQVQYARATLIKRALFTPYLQEVLPRLLVYKDVSDLQCR